MSCSSCSWRCRVGVAAVAGVAYASGSVRPRSCCTRSCHAHYPHLMRQPYVSQCGCSFAWLQGAKRPQAAMRIGLLLLLLLLWIFPLLLAVCWCTMAVG